MIAKPVNARADARRLPTLPDPTKMGMQQATHFVLAGVTSTVAPCFPAPLPSSTTTNILPHPRRLSPLSLPGYANRL